MGIDLSAFRDEYPFESHYLEIDGVRYHYLDEGAGEAILMLHGNPTWSFYYRKLALGMRDSYRVIVPDHVGCGLSDKPQQYEYRLEQHIANVGRLVEALKLERLNLAVHDWGGAIGFGFALRRPEIVKRFVVFNTAAFLSPNIPWRIAICRTPGFGDLAIRGFNAFARAAIFMACAKRERMTPAVRAGYLAPYNSWANRIATLRFVQDIPMSPRDQSYALMKTIDEQLGRFQNHPMLICWGAKDFCFNDSFLRTWRERFPKARIERFEDAGHYVVEDAHEEIIPLMRRFLSV
ncbi:MAG: alpha/beta fold hydrolase [Candidatus Sumerlaeota bacterium]|nr:alpha/beta fold hydrolase [Candidatus Sumerlaeota bacterium]